MAPELLLGEENPLNAIDRATDEMREIAKRWQDRLTVERHSIAENYADGRVSLICDLNILAPDARVDRDARMNHCPLGDSEVFATAIFAVDRSDMRNVFLRDQEPVLVFNVESVKTPQGFSYPPLYGCTASTMKSMTALGAFFFSPPLRQLQDHSGWANRELVCRSDRPVVANSISLITKSRAHMRLWMTSPTMRRTRSGAGYPC